MTSSETQKALAKDFAKLGVTPGDVLMTHSSLKSFGKRIRGGANSIIEALIEAVGPSGTLLFPALTYLNVTTEQSVFDVKTTPSNVGIIPETFRISYASERSLHPTHSACALGPLANALTCNHYLDTTPCGPNSPFHLLPKHNGKVLMIGCPLKTNTSMHAIEEIALPPYLYGKSTVFTIIDKAGNTTRALHKQHGFSGYDQAYERILDDLPTESYSTGTVLGAHCVLMNIKAVWETAIPIYEKDPYHFVSKLDANV